MASENLIYATRDALDAVASLVIDDGVEGRGHRLNIFQEQI